MPSHCRPGLAFVLLLAGALGVSVVGAQSSGRFPDSGNNAAIVIQYSMTGVAVTGAPRDNGPSMQWHRNISGKVTGRRIGLNATVTLTQPGYPKCNAAGGGFYFTVEARVSAGSKRATFVHPASGACRDAQFPTTVNLAVDVPDDATSAGISVRATYVNPMYGDRVSLVNGEFTATPRVGAGGGGGARPTPPSAAPTPFGGDDGTDGADDGLPPWVKVVGTAAALAAGVAMISRILSSRRARKPTRPPQYGYILQLSAEEIQVEEGKPATVSARVWRVDEQGATSPVPDAPLAVASPDPALQVSPDSGKGTIECTVALVQPPSSQIVVLSITAETGGQRVHASVRVVIQPLRLGAWVAGLKEADAFFDARARAWGFRDIVAFFHDTGEKPCTPPAGCTFQVAAVPDVLEAGPARSDDGLTWTLAVRLRPGTNLDAHLGPLLQRHEGRVKATVTATAADGRVFASTVAYRLRPTLTVFLRAFDGDPQHEDGHEYVGAVLPPGELVADGRDAVHLVAFACRTDLADDPRRAFERRFPAALDLTVELTGRDADAFQVCPPARLTDPALLPRPVPEGCTAFAVSARRPILHDGRTREVGARLRAKLLDSRHTSGYEIAEDTVEITLSVEPVFLKLWVVPGRVRGTSEACCYACLAQSTRAALLGLPLALKVERSGAGSLEIEGPQPVATDQHGVARWTLRYGGLTWENSAQARFTVRCGCPGAEGTPAMGTEWTVDVGANVTRLVQDLHDQRDALNLTNRAFASLRVLGLLFPDSMSGPYTDARHTLGASDWDPHICAELAARINDWMIARRFGNTRLPDHDPTPRARMNGVEISKYSMWLLGPLTHHFAGFFLSGADSNDSPRFADPWWYQEWDDPQHRTLEGLYTRNTERYLLLKFLATAQLVVMLAGQAVVASGIAVSAAGVNELMAHAAANLARVDLIMGDAWDSGVKDNILWQDGTYVGYQANWARRAVEHFARTHPVAPPVECLHAW